MEEMTWLHSCDLDDMLPSLEGGSNRKLRLLCCACVRRVWYRFLHGDPSCRAVEVAEQFADGQATDQDLLSALSKAEAAIESASTYEERNARRAAAWSASLTVDAMSTARSVAWGTTLASQEPRQVERVAQAQLLRDIFNYPFRQCEINPDIRTSTVLALAQQIYQSRDFGTMPILADGLEDAGCTDSELLSHCRRSDTHDRGCWVVDLILGKK